MWFWFSLTALLCWSGSDLFSKIGCRDPADKYSHLKMLTAVGAVMGLHALYSVCFGGVSLSAEVFLRYLPVSALYILSMAIGYFGLRYIELSISSPICNSSGAIVAILTVITVGISEETPAAAIPAIALVCLGVIALGLTEAYEDDELRRARQDAANYHYAKSWLALTIPVIYCLLDALGTVADNRVLEVLDEGSANAAYEMTFFLVGVAAFIYTRFVKKQKYFARQEAPKYLGAVFETAGQFFYIFAVADTEHLMYAAPMISSYCTVSVLWGRLFLKEKLSVKHYLSIAAVIAGIIIMGILDI